MKQGKVRSDDVVGNNRTQSFWCVKLKNNKLISRTNYQIKKNKTENPVHDMIHLRKLETLFLWYFQGSLNVTKYTNKKVVVVQTEVINTRWEIPFCFVICFVTFSYKKIFTENFWTKFQFKILNISPMIDVRGKTHIGTRFHFTSDRCSETPHIEVSIQSFEYSSNLKLQNKQFKIIQKLWIYVVSIENY